MLAGEGLQALRFKNFVAVVTLIHCATRAVALVGLRIRSLKRTCQNLAGYF